MNRNELEALRMKSACLDWLRFERRCHGMCTEVGSWSADVIGITRWMYEIEVKRTREDFLADFTNKVMKHKAYSGDTSQCHHSLKWIPHFFYFCVPQDLVPYAMEKIKRDQLPYGIMVWEHKKTRDWRDEIIWTNSVQIELNAQRIHKKPIDVDVTRTIFLRMGSEVARTYHKLLKELR